MDGADGVYPPSEDTYLLIDALHADLPFIKSTVPPFPITLEIGCGEGEVTQAVVALLPTHCHSLATDINALAARKAGALLRSAADILTADLFTSFAPATVFDIVLFNPPYVPTDASELQRALTSRDISASWAGGPPNGRHIIDNFLRALPNFMSSTSIAYLVLVHENDPDDVHALAERLGLRAKIVLSRKAGLETLYIMRFILFS